MAFACANPDPANETAVTWCEARSVLQQKCVRCHQDPPQNEAPFPLLTFEDVHATPYAQMYDVDDEAWELMLNAVETGFMPPVTLFPDLDPPVEPLTDDEKNTLLDWLRAEAPANGPTDCP